MKRRRLGLWLGLLAALGLAAGVGIWFSIPPIHRYLILAYLGLDSSAVRLHFTGRVLDRHGKPVHGARVHGRWRAFVGGESSMWGSFTVVADAEGRYERIQTESDDRADAMPDQVRIELELRAHGRFDEFEPSSPLELELGGRERVDADFSLGPPRPTLPVHVTDAAGAPVTQFWVYALRAEESEDAEGPWPSRHHRFPDGVAELAVPPAPFRVRVHANDPRREVIVGPFDPREPPARIDVALPGRGR